MGGYEIQLHVIISTTNWVVCGPEFVDNIKLMMYFMNSKYFTLQVNTHYASLEIGLWYNI